MALVALAAAGLVGGGLVGVSQLVSADRPTVSDDASLAAIATPGDDTDDTGDDGDDAPEPPDAPPDSDGPNVDGQIVIDTGDGEPLVIDIGDKFEQLQECGLPGLGEGPWFEHGDFPDVLVEGTLDDFLEGLPIDDLEARIGEFGELGDFGDFGDFGEFGVFDLGGTHVTVAGPDGVSIVDLGESGSVTITKDGDDVSISTDGDATVDEMPAIEFGPLGDGFDPGEFEELFGEDFDPEAMFDEFFEHFGAEGGLDEMFGEFEGGTVFDFELPADLEDCLNGVNDG